MEFGPIRLIVTDDLQRSRLTVFFRLLLALPHLFWLYLWGIAGHPELSPAMRSLAEDGWEVVVPSVAGFDGEPGFVAPDDHLGWLTMFWDAIDATGALPCPVVGASIGGMVAAELAALRPEAVTALGLVAPFGIGDGDQPGLDVFAVPASQRMEHLFAKGVPESFANRFSRSSGKIGSPPAISMSSSTH